MMVALVAAKLRREFQPSKMGLLGCLLRFFTDSGLLNNSKSNMDIPCAYSGSFAAPIPESTDPLIPEY